METEELQRKLLGLWERTTHNSKELLSNLFEYYFDESLIAYKEEEGKIVSAICGIPYKFGFGDARLNGLYLIVLSSEEAYKNKGVFSALLEEFHQKTKGDYDFTFIVPQNELLTDYFGSKGFNSSFFVIEERFTPPHDFRNDYFLSLNDSEERTLMLKRALIDTIRVCSLEETEGISKEEIIKYIRKVEKGGTSSINLEHSELDLEYLLGEHSIKNLSLFVALDSDNHITGVAFTEKDDIKRTKVSAYYVTDACSYYSLLDYIKKTYFDHSLTVVNSDPKYQSFSLLKKTYAASNPAGGDLDNTFDTVEIAFNINKLSQPTGMVRILNFENILKYISQRRSDVDFKLFIRDYIPDFQDNREESPKVYTVKNGKFQVSNPDDLKNDKLILNLTSKETAELLLRKNDTSNLIMEAFGIPGLNLQFRLLPC